MDPGLRDEGRWFDYRGARVRLRHFDHGPFQARLLELYQEFQAPSGASTPEDQEQALRLAFCEKIVSGWEGLEESPGKPLEFSPEAAAAFASDDGLRHVLDEWMGMSKRDADYSVQSARALAKKPTGS